MMIDSTTGEVIQASNLPTLPPQREIMNPARYWSALSETLSVEDQPTFELAALEIQKLKADIAALSEKRLSFTRPLDALKKSWMEFFGAPISIMEGAESIYKRKLLGYKADQERKRREEEDKIRARMEEERMRREAEAAELARRADADRQQAAEAVASRNFDQAAQHHARADSALQEAQRVIAQPMVVQRVETQVPKAAGITSSYTYSADVEDLRALIIAVAEGKESIALIDPDAILKRVSARARIEKDAFKITGCKLVKTQSLSSRPAGRT